MDYGYMHYGGMSGPDIFGVLFSIVVLVDLVLVGWWLWKQINK
jgi:hypothetical protein